MKKQKTVTVYCDGCNKPFETEKFWWGSADTCDECVNQRTINNFCKRHGGKKGLDCYPCKLEAKF